MVNFCCKEMLNNIFHIDKNAREETTDKIIFYSSKFNEYGIPVHDGENGKATSYILIQHCPWCGKKLPESRRDEWFDLLEKLGFDSPFDEFDMLPTEFKTSEWWEKR